MNLKFIYICVFTILIIISQSCVKNEPPKTSIPQDKLVKILKDLMLIDAAVQIKLQDKIAENNKIAEKELTSPIINKQNNSYDVKAKYLEIPFDKDSASAGLYRRVLDKHGVTPAQFEIAYRAYLAKPDFADTLYSKVLEQLSMEESQLKVNGRIK